MRGWLWWPIRNLRISYATYVSRVRIDCVRSSRMPRAYRIQCACVCPPFSCLTVFTFRGLRRVLIYIFYLFSYFSNDLFILFIYLIYLIYLIINLFFYLIFFVSSTSILFAYVFPHRLLRVFYLFTFSLTDFYEYSYIIIVSFFIIYLTVDSFTLSYLFILCFIVLFNYRFTYLLI